MRRSLILLTLLAASVAVLGACDPKTEAPKTPVATPSPVQPATPIGSPVASPTGSPAKPGSSPEVKKTDDKNAKPAETPKAK